MRHRPWLFLLLLVASAAAHAHGIEVLIFTALIYGIGFGVVGGVVNGIIRKEKVLGLIITMAFYFLAGFVFATFDTLTGEPISNVPPTPFFEDALFAAGLQAYGGVIPLVVSFLCAHVLVRFARSRLQ